MIQNLSLLSCVQLLVTPWTVARQAPLHMGFPWQNTGAGSHSFLQGIFSTQEWNLHLQLGKWILYPCTSWEAHVLPELYLYGKKSYCRIFL